MPEPFNRLMGIIYNLLRKNRCLFLYKIYRKSPRKGCLVCLYKNYANLCNFLKITGIGMSCKDNKSRRKILIYTNSTTFLTLKFSGTSAKVR